jgi:hypothetical protein
LKNHLIEESKVEKSPDRKSDSSSSISDVLNQLAKSRNVKNLIEKITTNQGNILIDDIKTFNFTTEEEKDKVEKHEKVETARHKNPRLSYDFKHDGEPSHQNPISSKEKKLMEEIVGHPQSGGSSKVYSKNTLKSYLNQSKNILNISKIDVPKIKKMPSKTESNSKSKSRDSNITMSRVNSVSQSKSQSKSKNKPSSGPLTQVVTATLNTMVKKDEYNKTGSFMKLNKYSSKPLIGTTVNDLTHLKSNPSQTLLNDYNNKANHLFKRSMKGDMTKPSCYSTNNIDNTVQFKKPSISPAHNKKAFEKKKILNPSLQVNPSANLTMNETKKNLPRKIMDLTYNTNHIPIAAKEQNKDDLKGLILEGENKEGVSENIMREVKSNLDENYQNLFNFSYYNFLNKDNSESMHSKSKSMHSKNTYVDNEIDGKYNDSLYKKDIYQDISCDINEEN